MKLEIVITPTTPVKDVADKFLQVLYDDINGRQVYSEYVNQHETTEIERGKISKAILILLIGDGMCNKYESSEKIIIEITKKGIDAQERGGYKKYIRIMRRNRIIKHGWFGLNIFLAIATFIIVLFTFLRNDSDVANQKHHCKQSMQEIPAQ